MSWGKNETYHYQVYGVQQQKERQTWKKQQKIHKIRSQPKKDKLFNKKNSHIQLSIFSTRYVFYYAFLQLDLPTM